MVIENIVVKGAREHNLRNIDVNIPRNKLVVITGPSGSGKSTLAFDTIYAEGQRRYVESLSAYARQFLGRMDKPDVDYIEGLSPAISIDQKGTSHNPRSTVGTVTEIYDYLRLLFARVGRPHCPKCGRLISRQTVQQIVESISQQTQGKRLMVLAPVVVHKKGEHKEILESARKAGFVRIRVDGSVRILEEEISLDKKKWHDIEIIVDRLVLAEDLESSRVTEAVETALRFGESRLVTVDVDNLEERTYSEQFACTACGISLPEIEPRTFSFNSPHGACSVCSGLGVKLTVDPDLVVPNKELSLSGGAIQPWARAGTATSWYTSVLLSMAEQFSFSPDVPIRELPENVISMLLYGDGVKTVQMRHRTRRGREWEWETKFEGVIANLERRYRDTQSDYVRREIERYMAANPCDGCNGDRLKPESLAVTIADRNIIQVTDLPIWQASEWVLAINGEGQISEVKPKAKFPDPGTLNERESMIANQILKEIGGRLKFLLDIGLGYLNLSRAAGTLSGGEAQRIRLATQIGSGLTGVLYVCDEPSIGLHSVDNARLIETLKNLRNLGNTVIIVEHDEAVMRSADHLVDLGPGAGEHGGRIVAEGTISKIESSEDSTTGAYLSGRVEISLPQQRRKGSGASLKLLKANANNLQKVDVEIPLGQLVCVTGVSGSGKSTLVYEVLYKWLAQRLYQSKDRPGQSEGVLGVENIDKVVNIDQTPIGRTPRSNPATYTGAFTPIRELFSSLPESKARGYAPGRFSFNVKGGRCEACSGDGYIEIQMQFLPDVTVPCEVCGGKRYNNDALEIKFKNKTIAEILSMTVAEAFEFFEAQPRIKRILGTLRDVGLGYIKLGQPATTISGGEAQRVKLATELSKKATGKTLYIMDEPTTGLAFDDCAHLLRVLHRLVDQGNTVLLIEHHMDLIKNADWIIDVGPGAGFRGGKIVAAGSPEKLIQHPTSPTARYLAEVLNKHASGTKTHLTKVGVSKSKKN